MPDIGYVSPKSFRPEHSARSDELFEKRLDKMSGGLEGMSVRSALWTLVIFLSLLASFIAMDHIWPHLRL